MDILTILHKLKVDDNHFKKVRELKDKVIIEFLEEQCNGKLKTRYKCYFCNFIIGKNHYSEKIYCKHKSCEHKNNTIDSLLFRVPRFNDILISLEKGEENTIELIIPILENERNEIKKMFEVIYIR